MKCVLSGSNARVFAKAVQSLSKFGTDLFIEADDNGFQLRSVNANKSAVGTFKFFCSFFDGYDIHGGSSDEENCCRLSMKACLGVFKNMKQVETCHIKIEPSRSKFLVQMNCRYETVKHFIISIIDDENISADVPMDDAPNSICGPHKIFTEIMSNFQMAEEEITLEAHQEALNVKNYVEGSRVNEKFMRSKLKLTSAEFDDYNITEETSVTFCLREFRAFLLFAESLFENVKITFHDAGRPIIFRIRKLSFFEATLIMSTLSPDDVTMCEDLQERSITESFMSRTAAKSAQKRKPAPSRQSKRKNNTSPSYSINQTSEEANVSTKISKRAPPRQSQRFTNTNATEMDSMDFEEEIPDFELDMQSIDIPRHHPSTESSEEPPRIPNISVTSNAPRDTESEVIVTFVETEEKADDDDEQIQQSPGRESTQLRSIFSRCFEATYIPREPSPDSQVYVPDSDEEK